MEIHSEAGGFWPMSTEHPSAGTVAAYLDGALDTRARSDFEAHAAECAECRDELRELVRLVRQRRRRLPRLVTIAAPAAAAAAIVLLMLRPAARHETIQPSGYREPGRSVSPVPVPIAPRGSGPRPERMIWTSVPNTHAYEITLYDDKGTVLWETPAAETAIVLPERVTFAPGRSYFWRVEARTGSQRTSASDLVEFSVQVVSK